MKKTLLFKLLLLPLSFLLMSAEDNLITLTVQNNTDYAFYYLYLSSTSSTEWGEDRLGDEVISAGEEMSFLIESGSYDIKIVDEDDDACIRNGISLSRDVSLTYDNSQWIDCINSGSSSSTSSSSNIRFTVDNNSNYDFYNIYLSPSSASEWGDDKLGSEILYAGSEKDIFIAPGEYDIKIIDEDGDDCIRYGVNIRSNITLSYSNSQWLDCAVDGSSSSSSSSSSSTYSLTFTNSSLWSIYHIYASSSSSSEWGDDKLGATEVLSNGESKTIYLTGGTYDFKFIDEDGDECIFYGVEVDESDTFDIGTEGWLDCIGD